MDVYEDTRRILACHQNATQASKGGTGLFGPNLIFEELGGVQAKTPIYYTIFHYQKPSALEGVPKGTR